MLSRTILISVPIIAMLPEAAPVSGQETFQLRAMLELVRQDTIAVDARTIVKECTHFLATNGYSSALSAKVLEARGKAYLRLRMWSAAKDDADELCRLQPKNPVGFRLRASAHAGLGDLDRAATSSTEATRLEPSIAKQHAFSALQLAAQGRLKEARELLDKAAAIEPRNAEIYDIRACFFQTIDPEQCLLAINRFLELDPEGWLDLDHPEDFLLMHAKTLLRLNQPRQALTRLLAARKFRPAGDPAITLASLLTTAYGQIGSSHAALLYAREYARLEPKSPFAHTKVAKYSAKVGDAAAAIAAAERALALAPDHKVVHVLLGDIYFDLGRYGDTRKHYERAIALDPDYAPSYYCLARFLATCPDAKERDGARAVKLARDTYEKEKKTLRRWEKCGPLMVLAESLAEASEYALAGRYAKEAIECAGPEWEQRDLWLQKLATFEKQMPWRTQPAAGAAAKAEK